MSEKQRCSFSKHGIIGIILIAIFWALNWALDGVRTHVLFFPLWLGYALTVDALVFRRKGTSLLTRSWARYIGLFLISAPSWWLFELINVRTQNWFYMGKQSFTSLEYAIFASFSFSTVIPAVFGTAELAGTFKWIRNLKACCRFGTKKSHITFVFILGWLMLAAMLMWPRYFFPFVWLSVYFIIEPVNVWLGHRSLFDKVKNGNWTPVVALWIGCLICGFFWEMWNYYAYPKWVYEVPFVDFLHIFEMPVVGYLGYIPFSMELFALYHLITSIIGHRDDHYIQLT